MARQIDFGVNVNTRCPVIYPEHYPAPRMVDLGEELTHSLPRLVRR